MIRRAAELRLRSQPTELVARLEGSFVSVREREVRELLAAAREELGLTAAGRERFRMSLLRPFYEEYGRIHGAGAIRNFDEVEQALRSRGYLDRVLKAAWPPVPPDRLVRRLLTSKAALAEAADGHSRPGRAEAAARGAAGLVGRRRRAPRRGARRCSTPPPHVYGHVIVDEAQDLTPMQLRMIARRSRDGSLTILGDVAQATGAIAYRRWDELLPHLPHGDEAVVEELRHAYRVPREIMERRAAAARHDRSRRRAADLLPHRRAPADDPPASRRSICWPRPSTKPRGSARADGLLAVIAPDELVADAPRRRPVGRRSRCSRRARRKGLEFDHVVVVEPALIAAHEQGLRELYVALTRPTKTLVVVHARPCRPRSSA